MYTDRNWHIFLAFRVPMNFEKLYHNFYNWVLAAGPRIISAIVFFVIVQWLIRLLKRWMHKALVKKGLHSSLKPFLVSLTSAILQILSAFVTLQILDVKLTIFTVIVGGISVAAGLALSGTLQNFTSSILILLLKPYKVGDTIVAQGFEGTVKFIQIFHTIINTYDNKTVIIPNSKLSNELIVNLSCEKMRRLEVTLKMNFGLDFEKVKTVLLRSVNDQKGVIADPRPFIRIDELQADGYIVTLNVWLLANEYNNLKSGLYEKIMYNLKSSDVKLQGM